MVCTVVPSCQIQAQDVYIIYIIYYYIVWGPVAQPKPFHIKKHQHLYVRSLQGALNSFRMAQCLGKHGLMDYFLCQWEKVPKYVADLSICNHMYIDTQRHPSRSNHMQPWQLQRHARLRAIAAKGWVTQLAVNGNPKKNLVCGWMRLGVQMADGHSIVNFRMVSSLVVQKGTDQLVIGTCRWAFWFMSVYTQRISLVC